MSLPPREAWIEIKAVGLPNGKEYGRFPHGKRGLKYQSGNAARRGHGSLPPREAWIEINMAFIACHTFTRSLPPREAWIEITKEHHNKKYHLSLPPREAWIEIS